MKKIICSTALCFCFVLTGCSAGEIRSVPKTEPLYSATDDYSRYAELQNGFGSVKFISGLDYQYYFQPKDGKSDSMVLFYYDPESRELLPVNGVPGNGCSVDNFAACTGSFQNPSPENFQIYNGRIFYENHVFSEENDRYTSEIWMANLDGSEREKLFSVELPETDAYAFGFFFRDNALFLYDQARNQLLRYDLSRNVLETAADLSECTGIGHFFQDEEGIYINAKKYRESLNPVLRLEPDQTLSVQWENRDAYYADADQCLYLQDGKTWYEKDGMDPVLLQEEPCFTLMGKDRFILGAPRDNGTEIFYYDADGNLLDQITEVSSFGCPQILTESMLMTRNYIYRIEDNHLIEDVSFAELLENSGVDL